MRQRPATFTFARMETRLQWAPGWPPPAEPEEDVDEKRTHVLCNATARVHCAFHSLTLSVDDVREVVRATKTCERAWSTSLFPSSSLGIELASHPVRSDNETGTMQLKTGTTVPTTFSCTITERLIVERPAASCRERSVSVVAARGTGTAWRL